MKVKYPELGYNSKSVYSLYVNVIQPSSFCLWETYLTLTVWCS